MSEEHPPGPVEPPLHLASTARPLLPNRAARTCKPIEDELLLERPRLQQPRPLAPDRALPLYRDIIAEYIAQPIPRAYESAQPYLHKVKALLAKTNHAAEWSRYVANLRQTPRAKRRFLEVLDRLKQAAQASPRRPPRG